MQNGGEWYTKAVNGMLYDPDWQRRFLMSEYYKLGIDEIAKSLDSNLTKGLGSDEGSERIVKYGHNALKEAKAVSPFEIFIGQFKDFIVWVLIGAALVSGFLKEWVDAFAIIGIVILNAILGFIQEYRAEKSLAALKKLSSPNSKVIRDGVIAIIPSAEIVPGDIIEVEAGDHIPADGRLIYISPNFTASEASLTGESTPVTKGTLALEKDDVPLADRTNMVYMGTSVSSGKARAIIIETGMSTELGKIAGMIQTIEREDTPLQRKLEEFGKWIVYVCFVLVGMVFVMGVLRGGKIIDMFLTAVSLAVAAIPEGLPAVVTIALALGVQRMVKRHVLIRKLPAVETLGCTTVICSDKTGTLTKNEMTVQMVYAGGKTFSVTGIGYEPKGEFRFNNVKVDVAANPELKNALLCGTLCNGALVVHNDGVYKVVGDPTEGAILVAVEKAGMSKEGLTNEFPFVEEIPFDSVRKMMTVVRKDKDKITAFVKGAPEMVLQNCTKIEDGGKVRAITLVDKEKILEANIQMADNAMRVLGVSYRHLDKSIDKYDEKVLEKDLVFTGLLGMIDPPREEVKAAMKECKTAGIRTVMITGDHKNTASAIARQLGFFGEGDMALSGEELDKLSEMEFKDIVEKTPVYARVSPEHKLRIVSAWREKGEVVAMTGDGVNDAPAVKEADIGVAMGITGTDVTKEVSDMVITDDNFASIVAAVSEGRGVYDNIKKFVHYLLSCNAGEILVMFTASLFGLPAPLLPIHILWVNLVTDGMPALALGVDPVSPDVMKRPPRPKHESIVTKQRAYTMLWQGALIAFCSLTAFSFVMFVEKEGLGRARTAAFIVLSCAQLFHSFNCRDAVKSLFKIGVFTNMKLIYANLVSFVLQMGAVYLPFAQKVFKTEPLGIFDWFMVITISSVPLWAMEIVKFVRKNKGE